MTQREAFEKVKTHLLAQMAKSRGTNLCLYRDPNGLKCAIGCLIPDEEYRKEFDSGKMSLAEIQTKTPALQGLELGFLNALQRVHDMNPPDKWAERLDGLEAYWTSQGLLS